MMKKNITLIFVLLIVSCSKNQVKENGSRKAMLNDDWTFIEKIESEKWNKEKLVNIFGTPSEVIEDKKKILELLVYDYPQLGHQKWGFEIDEKEKVVSITFVPNISNDENFTLEKITHKWGASCTKKKEIDSSQHFVRNIYYLDCGKNHRAYLNKYDEVTSLAINILR